LECALAHSAEEGFAYTLIHSGDEEQQVRPLEQLVDNPCGVGIVWDGVITPVLHKQRESGSYHRVCAEYSYCGGLAVLLF
jgi:hypothetical protein